MDFMKIGSVTATLSWRV